MRKGKYIKNDTKSLMDYKPKRRPKRPYQRSQGSVEEPREGFVLSLRPELVMTMIRLSR